MEGNGRGLWTYFLSTCSIPETIFSILVGVSTYPPPLILEWRQVPSSSSTSNFPEIPGILSPMTSIFPAKRPSSSAFTLRNFGS